MPFDFKKEYKQYYKPKEIPTIIEIPKMKFITFQGMGDPGEENGEYTKSIEALYSVAYTLRMSYKGDYKIKDFVEYVVPPLEGFWWQEGIKGVDYSKMDSMEFISLIRLPEFITEEDFNWAKEQVKVKKSIDTSKVLYKVIEEGLVVQCLHIGPFREEYKTVEKMHNLIEELGYELDMEVRKHHEIYLSDYRKVSADKLKTILRHPIKKK